jgi:hypothetical protein
MIDDVENGTVGSSFDDFLKEQGTYEATVDQAVKRVSALQQRRTARPLLPSYERTKLLQPTLKENTWLKWYQS